MKEKELITDKLGLNPILPLYEYIPDGEPHVFEDRIYLFGSHDKFNGHTFCMNDYVAYSAPINDLKNWKFEGYTYSRTQDPRYQNPEKDFLYAPDVVRGKDGKYYLYYCLNPYHEIAVAICDEPAGKYEFYGLIKYKDGTILGQRPDDKAQFDPGVFIDDDGKIYLYSGNSPRRKGTGITNRASQIMELEDDMLTLKTSPKLFLCSVDESEGTGFEGHEFFEASSMRKINGIYYFIYSSINLHELCYAYSRYPDKEFKYGGVIISNINVFSDGNGNTLPLNRNGNDHGSIECINGQWYIFYHRHTHVNSYSRQACVEKLYIDENGHIPQVEITTNGFADKNIKISEWISAGRACNLVCDFRTNKTEKPKYPFITQSGHDREKNADSYITNIKNNSLIGFKYFDCNALKSLSLSIRGDFKGTIDILDDIDGVSKGQIYVELDDLKEYKKYDLNVSDISGISSIYFYIRGMGGLELEKIKMNF